MLSSLEIYDLATAIVHLSGLTTRDSENPDGDIEIVEVGLRPGEKLYEELLIGNDPQPTNHPRIMMAHEYSLPECAVRDAASRVDTLNTKDEVVAFLTALVPEYVPMVHGLDS